MADLKRSFLPLFPPPGRLGGNLGEAGLKSSRFCTAEIGASFEFQPADKVGILALLSIKTALKLPEDVCRFAGGEKPRWKRGIFELFLSEMEGADGPPPPGLHIPHLAHRFVSTSLTL